MSENEKAEKRSDFQKMLDLAAARRADAMDVSYQQRLAKGAPRDLAYEKWGPVFREMIWDEIERASAGPKKDGPDLDKE
jgi:hypothetical protein